MRAHALPKLDGGGQRTLHITYIKWIVKWMRAHRQKLKTKFNRKSRDWETGVKKHQQKCVTGVFVWKEKGKVEQIFESCGSLSNLGITNLIVVPMWIECKTNKSNLTDRCTNKQTREKKNSHASAVTVEWVSYSTERRKKNSSRTNILKVAFQSDWNSNEAYDEI